MRVADPRQVALTDASGHVLIAANSAPLTAQLAPGLTAIRGRQGQLGATCPGCGVDDYSAGGFWLFADGTTEALPVEAPVLAAALGQGDLRIRVQAWRSVGRQWINADAQLVTPSSNVVEILEMTRVHHLTQQGVVLQKLGVAFAGMLAALCFGTATHTSGGEREALFGLGGVFSAGALALIGSALLDLRTSSRQTAVYRAP
jgi:hypothetical protein